MEQILMFIDELPAWVSALTALVTACAGVASLTPTKSDDAAIAFMLRIINVVGLNVNRAKNADDDEE